MADQEFWDLNLYFRYAGEFGRGKFSGYGVYTRQDNMIYQGQFQDGKPEGYGKARRVARLFVILRAAYKLCEELEN